MKINRSELIDRLKEITSSIIAEVEEIKLLDIDTLNNKLNSDSWSALECFEHLNRYGRFYIPEMQNRIRNSNKRIIAIFKSGWLGNYFS